jgi:nitrate/nitrite-specific signal transduction histidine kinase
MKMKLKTRRRVPSMLVAGALLWWLPGAGAASDDLSVAINKAGRQRMLSQRMVKAYCQVGLGVVPEKSGAQLAAAVELFESQLADLSRIAPDRGARTALTQLRDAWSRTRPVVTGPVTREGAARLIPLGNELLAAAHRVVRALQEAAATSYARLVNVSGRQRMLSQRVAMLYMLRSWRFDSPAIGEEIEIARNEFVGAWEALLEAPENTKEIRARLEDVSAQWASLASALHLEGTESDRLVVAEASESILASMEVITALYASLSHR